MKIVFLILFIGLNAFAEEQVGSVLCASNIAEKSLAEKYKMVDIHASKTLYALCKYWANQSYDICAKGLYSQFSDVLPLKDFEPRVARLEASAKEFCKAKADSDSNGFVFLILDRAKNENMSVDQAAKETIESVNPSKR